MIQKNTPSHYSASVMRGGQLYISGQLPIDAQTREHRHGSVGEETLLALSNLLSQVELHGGTVEDIVRTTAYTDGIDNWEAVNEAYAEFFGPIKPARTVIAVSDIHFGFHVEVEGIAVLPEQMPGSAETNANSNT